MSRPTIKLVIHLKSRMDLLSWVWSAMLHAAYSSMAVTNQRYSEYLWSWLNRRDITYVWSDGSKILGHTCLISASTSTHDINVYIRWWVLIWHQTDPSSTNMALRALAVVALAIAAAQVNTTSFNLQLYHTFQLGNIFSLII